MNKDIKVSVVCTVYNHAKHLKKCLDGIVMQRTNFPFEAIVHDDCSTDDSQKIILEYAQKYPHIIIPILQSENQYSKHDGSLTKAINPHINGQYVAICEGDDYWTDPYKLQKQVDVLSNNPDITLCFHNVEVVEEQVDKVHRNLYEHLHDGYFDADTIITLWTVPTCSAIMPKESYISKPYDHRFIVGDNVLWLNCCKRGKAYCINQKMGVYRRGLEGWTKSNFGDDKQKSLKTYINFYHHFNALAEYYGDTASKGINKRLRDCAARILIISIFKDRGKTIEWVKRGFTQFGFSFLKELVLVAKENLTTWYKRNHL